MQCKNLVNYVKRFRTFNIKKDFIHLTSFTKSIPRTSHFTTTTTIPIYSTSAQHSSQIATEVLLSTAYNNNKTSNNIKSIKNSKFNIKDILKGCEPNKKLKIAMLLSGGVDSSTALALLKSAGHEIEAFYLQIWFQEDFRNYWDACPWEEDLTYAQKLCNDLEIKLNIIPLTETYWHTVVSKSLKSIKHGLTPNPDLLCNSKIKFGAFIDYLNSQNIQYDRIGSGHYARIHRHRDGNEAVLEMTDDLIKDQTYFLAGLTQEQLKCCIFPLGYLKKTEVRDLANCANIPSQTRKDSQGICFLGKVKFKEFIKEHLGEWPGLILEDQTGKIVGTHKGYWFYTIGQRKGLGLAEGPWFVVKKDIKWNVVYVSKIEILNSNVFQVSNLNWLYKKKPDFKNLQCKIRHSPEIYNCEVVKDDGMTLEVKMDKGDQGIATGQYCVFYQNKVCLGCGVIHNANAVILHNIK